MKTVVAYWMPLTIQACIVGSGISGCVRQKCSFRKNCHVVSALGNVAKQTGQIHAEVALLRAFSSLRSAIFFSRIFSCHVCRRNSLSVFSFFEPSRSSRPVPFFGPSSSQLRTAMVRPWYSVPFRKSAACMASGVAKVRKAVPRSHL